jgi:rsbT co-antagonist protein RsbR
MSNLLGAIQKNRESLLQDWLKRLKAAVQRRDLISERELEAQAAEILSTIVDIPQGTTLEDFNAPGWQPLKAMLASLSVSRAASGFTPSETAVFVLSLKPSLFGLAREQRGNNADELFSEVVKATDLVHR